mgnify:CR=1 FL=1
MTNSQRGFTIPELLVVIGIMILMAALITPNWRRGNQGLALERAVHKVSQDITRARELALRAQFFQCEQGNINGYGIYWDRTLMPDSYLLFADCDNSRQYESNVDSTVETMVLEQGVAISSLNPDSTLSIVFVPPEPSVTIKPGNPSQAQIILALENDPAATRTITVTKRGIIDIQ